MNLKAELHNFEHSSFEDWVYQIESQIGKPFSSLNYKSYNDIELNAIYSKVDNVYQINKSSKTILFDKSTLNQYDKVYYFSDLLKNGLDGINEIAYIVYSIINEYNSNNKSILLISSIDTKFYDNILKFRALRYLLDNISKSLNLTLNYKILATISPLNKSYLDKETNIIRESSECISAFLAGVDFVSTTPFTIDNDDFAEYFSDNIVRIIENETYVSSIYDVVKGSYFFEKGTQEFIEKSFEKLQYFNSLDENELIKYINAYSNEKYLERISNLKSRKDKLIGVNTYINKLDNIKSTNKSSLANVFEEFHLKKQRYFEQFNKYPEIYVICFGSYSEIKARIDFIEDFFNAGAIQCKFSPIFESIEDAISSVDLINAKYNILLSTNKLYPSIVPDLLLTLKNFNPEIKIGLAGGDKNDEERFSKLGIDRFITLNSNLYNELTYIWDIFERNEENI